MKIPKYVEERLKKSKNYPYYLSHGVYTPEDNIRVFAVWYEYGEGTPTCYSFGARDAEDAESHIKDIKSNPTVVKTKELFWDNEKNCWS